MTLKQVLSVAAYAACSSSLLLLNKMAVMAIGSKTLTLLSQFFASIAFVMVLHVLKVDTIRFSKTLLAKFIGVAICFTACLYTNVKVLEMANVETVIVFRSLTPFFVYIVEVFYRKSTVASAMTWLCLIGIAVGAYGYCLSEKDGLTVEHYVWVVSYMASIVVEMVYVKIIISDPKKSASVSESVFYNNLLSVPVVLGMGALNGESDSVTNYDFGGKIPIAAILACVAGVGISYAGFNLRKQVSSTTYTVVGVVNKLATIMVNFVYWEHHAKPLSLAFLALSIFCGAAYSTTLSKKVVDKKVA